MISPFTLLWIVDFSLVLLVIWGYLRFYRPLHKLDQLAKRVAQQKEIRAETLRDLSPHLSEPLQRLIERLATLEQSFCSERFNLQSILSSMVEGVLVIQPDGRVALCNAQVQELFGLPQNPQNQFIDEIFPDSEVRRVIDLAIKRRHKLRQEITLNIEQKTEDRSFSQQRVIEINAVPMLEAKTQKKLANHRHSSDFQGIVVVCHEITPVKKIEDMRREFVANVSHELRTPLSVFQGYIETILDNTHWLSPEALRIMQVLQRHSKRLNALVQDLLTLSRLEFGQITLSPEPIEVSAFFKELEEDWQKTFEQAGLKLEFTLPHPDTVVYADRLRLTQLFSNLIDNALKFSKNFKTEEGAPHDQRTVSVGCTPFETKKMVQFFVKDQGIGIPEDKLKYIFDRFYRVDPARTREVGGTGLGLSIVKNIVLLHKGKIFAQSEFGKGTQFFFTLPGHLEPACKPS